MQQQDVREQVSQKLREMGHRPKVHGGNGRGPSEPQRRLAEALGWPMEYVVPTRQRRSSGYPTAYKIDIADPDSKTAIEVDGYSHCAKAVQTKDAKKTAFLQARGWSVLRFSNEQVLTDLDGCVRTVRSTTSKSSTTTTTS